MTMEYYARREQVSRGNAERAASAPARLAHLGLAAAYGALAATIRAVPVSRRKRPSDGAEKPSIARWEDEGGASR